MPQLDAALIAFGKLIGLLDASGGLQWTWFGDPLNQSLLGIPANRAAIGALMRALLNPPPVDESAPNQVFDAANGLEWEPFKPTDTIGVGPVWNKNTAEILHLGLGASASFDVSGQQLQLGLVARMLSFDNSQPKVGTEFGQVLFSSVFPVPTFFLNGATLTGGYTDNKFSLDLTARNKADTPKELKVSPPVNGEILAWDAARLAAFIVRSWVAAKAAENPADKGFYYRLDKHLFPMLGDPATPIQPLPPLDATGALPKFDAWRDSVIGGGDSGAGALTFLWHLRALITGTESSELLSGSSYFPVIVQGGAPPTFPPTSFPTAGTYPPNPDQAGVWVGIRDGATPNLTDVVLEFRSGDPANVRTIVVARFDSVGPKLIRPPAPGGANFDDLTGLLNTMLPLDLGGGNKITGQPLGAGAYEVTIFSQTVSDAGLDILNGTYSFSFVLHDGQPIGYKFDAPLLSLVMPPDNAVNTATGLLVNLLNKLLTSALGAADQTLKDAANKLITFITNTIQAGGPPSVTDVLAILKSIAALAGDQANFKAGPLTLAIAPNGNLSPSLELGPIQPEALQQVGISIGKFTAGASINFTTPANPLESFSFGFADVRLGQGGGPGATGLVSQLFPDLREVQGFALNVTLAKGSSVPQIQGGGKFPIQRTIGPLEIVSLLLELDNNSLALGVDLFFQLGPIKVVAYELGIQIIFKGGVQLFLHGLGVSFDGGGIKLTGLFLEIPQGPGKPSDYVGGAVVSVVNLFQLSAIGGYSTDSNGDASLFIFASLVAPLGGPPWFFITGIAGGFGYNRNLPSPELMSEHPFLKVMRGDLSFDAKNPQQTLVSLGTAFAVNHGQYWIAAGIQFTCFGFIQGKVIVAVSFGKSFSFQLLGMLSYGISPIAYFELAFMAVADEEHFLLKAGLSPNSYIIHPDIFSLQGDFALGVWYGGAHPGDFLVSIGGYHPYFQKPDYYPDLNRVGCKAVIYSFVHVSVECFFACTPQALMAGASVSLWASFAGIAAGLDVYIDVLIKWKPFYMLARMGVTVWFEFLGRHEIGVDLQIWTPPFGGIATIDLLLVSFDVSFGADRKEPDPPPLFDFISDKLGVPAKASGTKGALVSAFNTTSDAGLFHIDVTQGRTTKPPADSKKQEGIDTPVLVNSEFAYVVKTRLPISEPGAGAVMNPPSQFNGQVDLPLCRMMDLKSTLTLSGPQINLAKQTRLLDMFPAANFGPDLPSAQADDSTARQAVSKIDTTKPSIPMSDAISVVFKPKFDPLNLDEPTPVYLQGTSEEFSEDDPQHANDPTKQEEYPLPLLASGNFIDLLAVSTASFKPVPLKTHIKASSPVQSSRQTAEALNAKNVFGGFHLDFFDASVVRLVTTVNVKAFSVATPPAGVTAIDVPVSPVRRRELLPITLRVAPVRSVTPQPVRVTSHRRAVDLTKKRVSPDTGVAGTFRSPDLAIAPHKAGLMKVSGGRGANGSHLNTSGRGFIRAIFLGGVDEFLSENYWTAGQAFTIPSRARQIVLLNEGTQPPVVPQSATGITAPGILVPPRTDVQQRFVVPPTGVLRDNIGVEGDTILVALNARTFAAHGCTLQTSAPLRSAPKLFDTLPGAQVLRAANHFTVFFPIVPERASLVVLVEPESRQPGPALDQVRWAATDATLSELITLVSPNRTAFINTVSATGPWQVEIDLGPDWRVTAVALTSVIGRDLLNRFRQSADWSLIDDRVQSGPEESAINVNLEVSK